MTKAEIKELIFEEVELSDDFDFERSITARLIGYDESDDYSFITDDDRGSHWKYARPIQPKAKRIMTVEELWGKTLIHNCGESFIVNGTNGGGGIGGHKRGYDTIGALHSIGWKVNDKPSMDGATSLELESE